MRYSILLVLLGIVCFTGHESRAQTPQLAIRYYRAGQAKMEQGEWVAAEEDFTKAISMNARTKKKTSASQSNESFDESSANEISVSDPPT